MKSIFRSLEILKKRKLGRTSWNLREFNYSLEKKIRPKANKLFN